jgi:hypothetical protein
VCRGGYELMQAALHGCFIHMGESAPGLPWPVCLRVGGTPLVSAHCRPTWCWSGASPWTALVCCTCASMGVFASRVGAGMLGALCAPRSWSRCHLCAALLWRGFRVTQVH